MVWFEGNDMIYVWMLREWNDLIEFVVNDAFLVLPKVASSVLPKREITIYKQDFLWPASFGYNQWIMCNKITKFKYIQNIKIYIYLKKKKRKKKLVRKSETKHFTLFF